MDAFQSLFNGVGFWVHGDALDRSRTVTRFVPAGAGGIAGGATEAATLAKSPYVWKAIGATGKTGLIKAVGLGCVPVVPAYGIIIAGSSYGGHWLAQYGRSYYVYLLDTNTMPIKTFSPDKKIFWKGNYNSLGWLGT